MWQQCLLLSLAFCGVLSGCAVNEPFISETVVIASEPKIMPGELSFNEQVAALPEGSTQYFVDSPFGAATIDAGPLYLSGVGNECRSVRIVRGVTNYKCALCREENGKWHFIPTIFESMPR